MKRIIYDFLEGREESGAPILSKVSLTWSEKNETLARAEAFGEIAIEDDGVEEAPTQLDIIEAQLTYTAMMTDTLLEG